jgi:hypothetical protein
VHRMRVRLGGDGTPSVNFTYDTSTISGATNDIWQLTSETVKNGTTTFSVRQPYIYDAMGRLQGEQQCNLGNCTGTQNNISYGYERRAGAGEGQEQRDPRQAPAVQYYFIRPDS